MSERRQTDLERTLYGWLQQYSNEISSLRMELELVRQREAELARQLATTRADALALATTAPDAPALRWLRALREVRDVFLGDPPVDDTEPSIEALVRDAIELKSRAHVAEQESSLVPDLRKALEESERERRNLSRSLTLAERRLENMRGPEGGEPRGAAGYDPSWQNPDGSVKPLTDAEAAGYDPASEGDR